MAIESLCHTTAFSPFISRSSLLVHGYRKLSCKDGSNAIQPKKFMVVRYSIILDFVDDAH